MRTRARYRPPDPVSDRSHLGHDARLVHAVGGAARRARPDMVRSMGLLDRWRSSQGEQLLASLGPPRTGIILLDKRHHNLAQVEAFVENCRAAGFKADFLEFGRGQNAEYRVYSRESDCKDPRLPGEPGFLPLGDLRAAPPEYQAELPPGYHDPLVEAERLERRAGAGSDDFTPFE